VRERFAYVYGVDRSGWFWREQQQQDIPIPPIPGLPDLPANVSVMLPDPQQADTLPVALANGSPDKASVLFFDLMQRSLRSGDKMTRFVVTIQEGAAGQELPPSKPDRATIEACPVSASWLDGPAQMWDGSPAIDRAGCVRGTRDPSVEPVTWTFDLTGPARRWAKDPASNEGFAFVPVVGRGPGAPSDWQVNLKIPTQDDPSTPQDEYAATQNAVIVDMAFTTHGKPPPPGGGGSGGGGPGGGSGGGSGGGGGGAGGGSGWGGGLGSGGSIGGGGGLGGGGLFGGGSPGGGGLYGDGSQGGGGIGGGGPVLGGLAAGTGTGAGTDGPVPWYLWLLIPLAVLVLAALRSAVFEPRGSSRSKRTPASASDTPAAVPAAEEASVRRE
jgi:hypothetical protein